MPRVEFDPDIFDLAFEEAEEAHIEYYVGEHSTEDNYDEVLDEVYGDLQVIGCTFSASRVLKELDPIAYNLGLNDWQNSIRDDAEQDFNSCEDQIRQNVLDELDMLEEGETE